MATQVGAPTVPIYLAGEFVEAGTPLEVRNPATDELVATTFQAGPAELERAVVAAVEGFAQTRHLASYERRDALAHVAERIAQDADELAELLTRESGKPIRDARGEVIAPRHVVGGAGGEDFDLSVAREMLGNVPRMQLRAAVDRLAVPLDDDGELH